MTIQSPQIARLFVVLSVLFAQCNTPIKDTVTFYEVPLVCGAAPEIGCGSRIKPLFIDTEKEKAIKESWTNKGGTVLAIVWNDEMSNPAQRDQILHPLFEKHGITAEYISDTARHSELRASLHSDKDHWLKGMDVDKLSIEEAGVIAKNLTQFAEDAKIITSSESETIRKDIEEYFKKELVIVRTYDELKSATTQERWMRDGYSIYEKHIGKQRADSVSVLYERQQGQSKSEESCCEDDVALAHSEITCPKCGHKKMETMPTDVCLLKYTCEQCKSVLVVKDGDCCVFCSYGTHKCPSKQEDIAESK